MAAQEPVYSPMLVRALEGKGVRLIRPGQHHTLFLSNDGAVFSAGRPTYGRLGRRGLDAGSDEGVPSRSPSRRATAAWPACPSWASLQVSCCGVADLHAPCAC